LRAQNGESVDAGGSIVRRKEMSKKGRATDDETSTENTETRIAKSNLSRKVMRVSGAVFWPIAARKSDMIDGDDVREPEYAER
jgi:hypothetical protein